MNEEAKVTGRPWTVNGITDAGYRIDGSDANKAGWDFVQNPTAIVPAKADADFICRAANFFEIFLTAAKMEHALDEQTHGLKYGVSKRNCSMCRAIAEVADAEARS